MTHPESRPATDAEGGIDLSQLAHSVWRRRWIVAISALVGALLGLGASLQSTRYVSEGLLQMPAVDVGDFKRYELALNNATRLEQFLEYSGAGDTPAAERLRALASQPGAMAQAVRPEFGFTERDARQYGVRIADAGGLLGVRLRMSQPEEGSDVPLLLLAEYVRDTAIKIDAEARLVKWCLDYQGRERTLRNVQLQSEFLVEQQQRKIAELRRLVERTPGADALDARQVVSIEAGGERFLSPTAQIVAAEVLTTEYALAQEARDRERVAAALKRTYYCSARDALAEPGTGRAFLERLAALRAEALRGSDSSTPIIEHTGNVFELQRLRWNSSYLERTRFVVPPEGSQMRMRSLGRGVGIVLGTIVGTLLGIGLALLMSWWRQNRAVIVADD